MRTKEYVYASYYKEPRATLTSSALTSYTTTGESRVSTSLDSEPIVIICRRAIGPSLHSGLTVTPHTFVSFL